jgi:hypothetical protein
VKTPVDGQTGGPVDRMRRSVGPLAAVVSVAFVALGSARSLAAQKPTPAPGAEPLGAIVGVWQSDATQGVSARSSCDWTPQGNGVICDQTITTVAGVQHAMNFFTRNPKTGAFVFYVVPNPGDTLAPVPLTVSGAVWTYGGLSPDPNGRWFRTVNDFSKRDEYSWRLEVSDDGKTWRTANGGRSQRVLQPKR